MGIGTTIPTDQLHTTGTVRFQGLSGSGTRILQVDVNGRLVTSMPYNQNFVPQTIPDAGCSTGNGITSSITVAGQAPLVFSANISVRIDISHTYDGDLRIFLVAPNGNIIILALAAGGAGDNFTNTLFSDAGATNISAGSAPFTGVYKPDGGISTGCGVSTTAGITTFGGIGGGTINPNGVWSLKIFDFWTGNIGTLNSWAISFDGNPNNLNNAVFYTNNVVSRGSANGGLVNGSIYDNGTNIGIGNTNPTTRLEVTGTTKTTNLTAGTATIFTTLNANAITTTTLDAGAWASESVLTNGYAWMGSLLVQWGTVSYNSNGVVTITFPTPYPHNVLSVTATVSDQGGNGSGANVACKTRTTTPTSFQLAGTGVFSGDNTSVVKWIAIGN